MSSKYPLPQPIDTVPKKYKAKHKRILVWVPHGKDKGLWEIATWEPQEHAKKPNPYWDLISLRIFGILWMRDHQPTHWMEIPEPPTRSLKPFEGEDPPE